MRSRLTIPAKRLRAEAIAEYVRAAGVGGVVCFTCGNAAEELRRQGLHVVEVGPRGELDAGWWWPAERIARTWPHLLDATSGHLPAPLMARVAEAFRRYLGPLDMDVVHEVASGSGETVVCLAWAYPECRFAAVYDGRRPETRYGRQAPLNGLVRAVAHAVTGDADETA